MILMHDMVKRKSRPQSALGHAVKTVVGMKIPRLHGRAGSIPALGTIYNTHHYANLWASGSLKQFLTGTPIRLSITSM